MISAPAISPIRVERGRPTSGELAALTVALLLVARREATVASPAAGQATWTHGRGGYLSPRSWAREDPRPAERTGSRFRASQGSR